MNENRLRWVIAGFAFFVATAYFVWLSALYIKFLETNRRITDMAGEFYKTPDAEPVVIVESETVPDDTE